MGFLSKKWVTGIFGSKMFEDNGYEEPPRPQLSEMGQWAQGQLYGDIERALGGGGLLPRGGFGKMRAAYQKAYPQVERELESQLHRLVPAEDIKVQGFARGMLSRAYAGTQQDLREQEIEAKYNQQQEALGMGLSALMQEKGIATSITEKFNQQRMTDLANQAQFGTFGTQLGTGIGQMAGWMTPVSQRYAQGMSNQVGQLWATPGQTGQQQSAFGVGGGQARNFPGYGGY